MPRFLNTLGKPRLSIAICQRCSFKLAWSDLQTDPDTGLKVCAACVDISDPWRLPPRAPENIALPFTSPDVPLDGSATIPASSPVTPPARHSDFGSDFGPDFGSS